MHYDEEQMNQPQMYYSADPKKQEAADRYYAAEEYPPHTTNYSPEIFFPGYSEAHGAAGQGNNQGKLL